MQTRRAVTPLVLCVAVMAIASCTANDTTSAKDESPAYKLAAIDGEVPDAEIVREYEIPLNSLANKCTNPKIRIADMTVKSQELLRDEGGLDYSLLEILQQVNLSIPTGSPQQRCEDIFAAWVTLTLP